MAGVLRSCWWWQVAGGGLLMAGCWWRRCWWGVLAGGCWSWIAGGEGAGEEFTNGEMVQEQNVLF